MRRNGYLGASGQKSDRDIRSVDLDLLWDEYTSTAWWRFRHIFDVFMHNFHSISWAWPFDLESVFCTVSRDLCI